MVAVKTKDDDGNGCDIDSCSDDGNGGEYVIVGKYDVREFMEVGTAGSLDCVKELALLLEESEMDKTVVKFLIVTYN